MGVTEAEVAGVEDTTEAEIEAEIEAETTMNGARAKGKMLLRYAVRTQT